jgi:hypothetical protein
LPGPFLRALANVEGVLYAVSHGGLYKLPESGAAGYIGAITDDLETSIAGNRGQVTIAAGGTYYLFNGTSLTAPGSGRLSDVQSLTFLNQYTVMSGDGGNGPREIEWTTAGVPGTRNAIYFAEAESKDDEIVRVLALDGFLWVLKTTSLELWATTGSGDSAFSRQGTRTIGLLGYNLAATTPGGIFFVGSDKTARFLQGGEPRPVSTPAVDDALARSTPSHVFYYEDRGHRFCVIRFDDRPAWVYDASMDRWHERSSGADHSPWDIICSCFCYDQWHLGSRLGRVYRLGLAPVDTSGVMRRTAVSQPLYADSERFSINKLEFLGRFGAIAQEENAPNWITTEYGLPMLDEMGAPILADSQQPISRISAPGRVWLRVSRDGGYTWGPAKIKDVGKVGEYEARATFRSMGQFRHFTGEINITDPVDISILGEALVS